MTDTRRRPDRPTPTASGTGAVDDGAEAQPTTGAQAERIAPFVAWLATQEIGETTRRAHREAVEAFLTWCRSDEGPSSGRRSRYEHHLRRNAPRLLATAREGLDRYTQYQQIVALTLPIDHH